MKRIGFIDGRRIAGWRFQASATPGVGQVVDITDPSYGAVPSVTGMTFRFRPTGVKTGTAFTTAMRLELYPEGDSGYLSGFRIDVDAPVGSPNLNTLWAQYISMERLGGAVVGELCGINVDIDYADPATIGHHLRLYSRGAAVTNAIRIGGLGVINLVNLQIGTTPYIATAVGGVQDSKLRVEIAGATKYIPLHTA